jgi:hypothetical protein
MSEVPENQTHEFPKSLLEWAGQRSGGVRKPFFEASGRPCKAVVDTPLLDRLRGWVVDVVAKSGTPRSIFLVGGPGNGKTEAVEGTLRELDGALQLGGTLTSQFATLFSGKTGQPIPRMAKVVPAQTPPDVEIKEICIVQDASVTDAENPRLSPAALLVSDLTSLVQPTSTSIYIACVNRGILDDALTFATEHNLKTEQALLEAVIRSVGMHPAAPSCWPLGGFKHVAVWPMDVETLIWTVKDSSTSKSPAEQLLDKATEAAKWPEPGKCAAGDHCPFCKSRDLMVKETHRTNLLRVLRWYELATGKRWSFRDLFSLLSYLFAGTARQEDAHLGSPCEWAAAVYELSQKPPSGRADTARLRAPFELVGALYQHALFCSWPRLGIRGLRPEIRELEMQDDPGLVGFHHFLTAPRETSIPSTLKLQLTGLAESLDPAMADPSSTIELSARNLVFGSDIDARFSQSIGEGFEKVRRQLSVMEVDLLQILKRTDDRLSSPEIRRKRPATARRVQNLLRDFACRLVRRSLGVRHGVTRDQEVLADFEKVISGNTQLLQKAVKQVEALINDESHFQVILNSTFGEPVVPQPRRATVRTTKQKIKAVDASTSGKPAPTVRFLSIGGRGHPLALTFELFRSVRELEAGMLPASLPRPVVALLDTTRARLAGLVVRDEEVLDGAEMRIGNRDAVISLEFGEFVVVKDSEI